MAVETIMVNATMDLPVDVFEHINNVARQLRTYPDLIIAEYARRTAIDQMETAERIMACAYDSPADLLDQLSVLQSRRDKAQQAAIVEAGLKRHPPKSDFDAKDRTKVSLGRVGNQ